MSTPRCPLPCFVLILAAVLLLTDAPPRLSAQGPQNVLVVANESAPRSLLIARHYARLRCLPPDNLLLVATPDVRTATFSVFDRDVAEAVRRRLSRTGAPIRYIVLTDGLPLRVTLEGGTLSSTALLAVLRLPLYGASQTPQARIRNPYFAADQPFGSQSPAGLLLATHLVALTPEDALGLIDRSVKADRNPSGGIFLCQHARGPARVRNAAYPAVVESLKERGNRAILIGSSDPVPRKSGAIAGLFSGGVYSSLDEQSIRGLRFPPGAVADLLQSYGAVPSNFDKRNPARQIPVAWLIRRGITGIHGTVAEPYSNAFPDARLLLWYTRGHTLADAFHMALPYLYWQNLVIGDPLCAPYAARPVVRVSTRLDLTSGKARVEVSAEPASARVGVKSVSLFVDGQALGTVKGSQGVFHLDTCRMGNGDHHLLATALGFGPAAPCGWAQERLPVRNTALTVVDPPGGPEGTVPLCGPIRVRFNQPLAAPARDWLAVTDDQGRGVAGSVKAEGSLGLSFSPLQPFRPSSVYTMILRESIRTPAGEGLAGRTLSFRTAPAALRVTAEPRRVTAGEAIRIFVLLQNGAGDSDEAFRGRIHLSTTDPFSVLPLTVLLDPAWGGRRSFEATFVTAGTQKLFAEDPAAGLRGGVSVTVLPGPFDHVAWELPRRITAGSPVPAGVSARDRHGNLVPSAAGVFRIRAVEEDGSRELVRITFSPKQAGRVRPSPWVFPREGPVRLEAVAADDRIAGKRTIYVYRSKASGR